MASVTSEAVAKYWPLVVSWANKFNGVGTAEFDDLVQEGAIAVWQTLEKGHIPSNAVIVNAMRDWIRHVSHRGVSYSEALAG